MNGIRYFLDTEFREEGPAGPIEAISIGVASSDGRTYYAVYDDFDTQKAWQHEFLRKSVLQHLPWIAPKGEPMTLDRSSEVVKDRQTIASELLSFLTRDGRDVNPEVWTWYGAYDHVVLAQTFGVMSNMPKALNQFIFDLKAELARAQQFHDVMGPETGYPLERPVVHDDRTEAEGQHDALADAIWLRWAFNKAVEDGWLEDPFTFNA